MDLMLNTSRKVAFYSPEFGIERFPLMGGLGVLAGDFVKASADLGLPLVGVGLLYPQGVFRQKLLDNGQQKEWYDRFDPTGLMQYRDTKVTVPIENREVRTNAFEYSYVGERGVVPIILIDTEGNNHHRPWDDHICGRIYPSEHPYDRLAQEQVLGTGGVRTLEALGYKVQVHHLNEGHSALSCLELAKKYQDIEEAKKHIVFTTHTSLPAGIDDFQRQLAEQVLTENLPSAEYMHRLTGSDNLNMMRLAMAMSLRAYGVSPLHAEVSKYIFNNFPNISQLGSIDNGVHLPTWAVPEVQKLYENVTEGRWRLNPQSLEDIVKISDQETLEVHKRSRERLGNFLGRDPRVKGNATYNPEKLTIGYARRFTGYKQATLLFEQMDGLRRLGKDIQIIFSGKAHPRDELGKALIKEIFGYMKELEGNVAIWFIEDYDMQIAKYMVRGSDVWLNTPMRLLEASGTSGMKAAANFVPQLSIPDGWWMPRPEKGYKYPKGLVEGVTGWSIGRIPTNADFYLLNDSDESRKAREADRKTDAEDLVGKLESIVALWKTKGKSDWAKIMRSAAAYNASWFNAIRMVQEYFDEAYQIPTYKSLAA